MSGIDLVHVPYRSGPQVLTELAGGQIDLAVLPVALAQPFVQEGKVKALGVTSRQRLATLPQAPSLSETPGSSQSGGRGLAGLAGSRAHGCPDRQASGR